jgi:hypothetical protein
MSEQVVGSYAVNSYGIPHSTSQRSVRTTYEVYSNKTLVLRTIHEVQAVRYAREVQGEVHAVEFTDLR